MPSAARFGVAIRFLRKSFGYSIHQLAEKAGTSHSIVHLVETGNPAPPRELQKLEAAFNLTPTESDLLKSIRSSIQQTELPSSSFSKLDDLFDRFGNDGFDREKFIKSGIHSPTVFSLESSTMIRNVEGVLNHFKDKGLTPNPYVNAICRKPVLIGMSPNTVISNVEGMAQELAQDGISLRQYLDIACRFPSLFLTRPDHAIPRIKLLREVLPRDMEGRSVLAELIARQPNLLTFSENDLVSRYLLSVLADQPMNIHRSRAQIAAKLSAALGHGDLAKPVETHERLDSGISHAQRLLLRALIREGIIKGQLR